MGVDRSDYLVYGWKLPYEVNHQFGDNDINEVNPHSIGFIVDGMCGNYVVFGVVIKSTDDPYVGWEFTKIDSQIKPITTFANFSTVFDAVSDISLVETLDKYKIVYQPSIMLFSHYS